MHTPTRCALTLTFALAFSLLSTGLLLPANADSKSDSKTIPVIDGGIGPCSADFTVTDASGAPVYDTKVRVHIEYGFMGLHKLDLEVGTNIDGKARFEGLPAKTKRGLLFQAVQGDREGSAFDDPANTCKGQFAIALESKSK
jgi:hypothetical protein